LRPAVATMRIRHRDQRRVKIEFAPIDRIVVKLY
jgi:hypothetical protein